MAGVTEENRWRLAVFLLLLGGALIVGGLVLTFQHQQRIAATGQANAVLSEQPERLAQVIRQMLFVLLLLVGIFAIGTLAFLRWSRHFRRRLFRRPRPPTASEDVWSMHRLPEEPPSEDAPETTQD